MNRRRFDPDKEARKRRSLAVADELLGRAFAAGMSVGDFLAREGFDISGKQNLPEKRVAAYTGLDARWKTQSK